MERAFGTGCAKISPTAGKFGLGAARAPNAQARPARRPEREADEPGEHNDQQQRKDQQQVQTNVPARRRGGFVYQVKRRRGRRQPQGPAVAPLAKLLDARSELG